MKASAAAIAAVVLGGSCYADDLLFGGTGAGTIDRFDIAEAKYLGVFASDDSLVQPGGLDYGADGLYAASAGTNQVLRFDGATGASEGVLVDADRCPRQPGTIAFRGGLLYVLSTFDGSVSRFDAATGEPVDELIQPGAFGSTSADAMVFGPGGDIFLAAPTEGIVVRFDGATGQPESIVAADLPSPRAMDLGPDGNLYIALDDPDPFDLDSVRVFTTEGQDLGTFVKFFQGNTPTALRFGPDGLLYIALPTRIDIFNPGTRENVGTLAPDSVDDIGPLAFMPPACYADFTGDGGLDLFDFLAYVNSFNAGEAVANCTGDGALDLFDFLCFVNSFNQGC